MFYQGKRQARCACHKDYRSPVEQRRDAVLDKYGDDPNAYSPAILAELARDGLFDISAAFCPAGRLTMAETRAREAQGMARDSAETEGLRPLRAAKRGPKDAPPCPTCDIYDALAEDDDILDETSPSNSQDKS